MTKQVKQATTSSVSISITADETLNSMTVKAFATIILKGSKDIVDAYREQLNKRKDACLKTVQANWDNGILDKHGLPKGAAPNDLYNTVSESETMAICLQPENKERIELAANTIRSFIATACSEVSALRSKLAGKQGKVKTTGAKDESYI